MKLHPHVFLLMLAVIACDNSDRFSTHLKNLHDADPATRAHAASFLGDIGPEARSCIPALEKAMKQDVNPLVRVQAAGAISKIESHREKEVAQFLLKELDGKDSLARRTSIRLLGSIGSHAKCAINKLESLLSIESKYERILSALALYKIDRGTVERSRQIMIEGLSDKDVFVRQAAAEAIGFLGQDAKVAIQQLRRLVMDPDENVRNAATRSLNMIVSKD